MVDTHFQKLLCITTLSCFLLFSLCNKKVPPLPYTDNLKKVKPSVTRTIAHNKASFTQGLVFYNGKLFESTGIYGQSTIQIIDTEGKIQFLQHLDKKYFAEGCAVLNNKLYQITWQEQRCFVYSIPSLRCIDTITYTGEGWGLTSNSTHLIMSNGSDTLYFRNENFAVVKKLPVTISNKSLTNINELEYINGSIFANVWFSDYIFKIDPQTGETQCIIDCSELVVIESPTSDQSVLNGIAYSPTTDDFYITGKNWKNIFVVKLGKTIPECGVGVQR